MLFQGVEVCVGGTAKVVSVLSKIQGQSLALLLKALCHIESEAEFPPSV